MWDCEVVRARIRDEVKGWRCPGSWGRGLGVPMANQPRFLRDPPCERNAWTSAGCKCESPWAWGCDRAAPAGDDSRQQRRPQRPRQAAMQLQHLAATDALDPKPVYMLRLSGRAGKLER